MIDNLSVYMFFNGGILKLIVIMLFAGLVISSSYGAGQSVAAKESAFIFFGYLGISDIDNTEIDFTEYNISCATLSESQKICNASADEQGFFLLNCSDFLNHNISCFISNSITKNIFPIYFDIDDYGRSQVIKPTGKLFTPIGISLEDGTSYAGEIPEDNKPE